MRWRTRGLTCGAAARLIASAIEGRVASAPLDMLLDHVERCTRCRDEVETQMSVKRLLARRTNDALPDGFAQRLAARLDAEQARSAQSFDWRRWVLRLWRQSTHRRDSRDSDAEAVRKV